MMWQAETGAEFSGFRPACPTAHRAVFGGKITGDIEKFPEDLRIRELPRVEKLAATI